MTRHLKLFKTKYLLPQPFYVVLQLSKIDNRLIIDFFF